MRILNKIWMILLCFNVANAATYELVEKPPQVINAIINLTVFSDTQNYTTPAQREVAVDFTQKAFDLMKEETPERLRQAILLLHMAAEYGYPAATGTMAAYCNDSKYGLKPKWASMYSGQIKYWHSPAEREELDAHDRALALEDLGASAGTEEKLLPGDASDSARRSSGDTVATGSTGGDSSDGGEGISVAGAGAPAGVRHRKPGAGSTS